jgi:hypothetical protein
MKAGVKPKPITEKKIQITTNRCFTPNEIKSHGGLEALKIKMKNKVLEI